MIWFIGGTHFNHSKILQYCNRPFPNIEIMNRTIIQNWNTKVQNTDTVFHLGDWGMTKSSEAPDAPKESYLSIKKQLNGDIIVIRGNHDNNNSCKTIIENMVIRIGGYKIFLVHDPKFYNPHYSFIFTAHWHGKFGMFIKKGKTIIVDLSVELWNFSPVTINEILQLYSIWKKTTKDT